MAVSSMALDSSKFIDLESGEKNDPDQVDTMITELRTKFNAMLETVTGHYHTGTDSKIITSGITGFTLEDIAVCQILGLFHRGGF